MRADLHSGRTGSTQQPLSRAWHDHRHEPAEEAEMRLVPGRRGGRPGTLRRAAPDDMRHLAEFVATRAGVEAYLEPRTTVTDTTVVLVAGTGEWTRRRVDGADSARSFARKHGIPLYDAGLVGYPQRMRDWTAQRR